MILEVFYSRRYVGAAYEFDTTRKAKWVADALVHSPIPGVVLKEPMPVSDAQLCMVHDADYIHAIRTGFPRELAESQGFTWDPEIWPMAISTNGGIVAAASAALAHGVAGSLSSGLHHARKGAGEGFCTFNGLVIAARVALSAGARSILILDLDAHFGGGTHSLVVDDPQIWLLDISTNDFDQYPSSEQARSILAHDPDQYLPTIEECLKDLEHCAPQFDLCIYNAGIDPYENCSMGGLPGITREILAKRERMVFEWCAKRKLPVAFAIAGGYINRRLNEDMLTDLHLLTIRSAAGVMGC